MSDTHKAADEDLPYGDERSRIYRAAGGSKRCAQLLFVPERGTHDRFFPFADIRLMQVRKDGRELLIEFSERTVIVTGTTLRAVASAIGAHMCSRLEAFDAEHRDKPSDGAQPFIQSIEFFTRKDEEEQKRLKPKHEPETEARAVEKL